MPEYKLREGSIHEQFFNSRAKVQGFGGGYANGKTSAACVRTLNIARDYPGANILMGRATYPKLKDTLQKEFFKWCPPSWIERMPTEKNNTCYLKNGTIINFRYVQQGGKSKEEDTSNLLSATYDLVVIDQIEDPEFAHKDFLDLLGRLRGSTPYRGSDTTMPMSGPRWMIFTTNPTSNWVYRKLVLPYKAYKNEGRRMDGVLLDSTGTLMMDLFEGSTYENKHALEPDVLEMLESAYTGQYKDRYLLGKWAAYEGLIYPAFEYDTHVVSADAITDYLYSLSSRGIDVQWVKGYDYGIAAPSCYILGFVDHVGNIIVVDGFYEKEKTVAWQAREIERIDKLYLPDADPIYADPQIFKRTAGSAHAVGKRVSDLFADEGIRMRRGANDINGGIAKINSYLTPVLHHRNPFSGAYGAPSMYFSTDIEFLTEEMSNYRWKKNPLGDRIDEPVDQNDHALDALKYMMTPRTLIANVHRRVPVAARPHMTQWHEPPDDEEDYEYTSRKHRHA